MNLQTYLSSVMRQCITPTDPGKTLVVCDFAGIESRVLGWMSGCQRINEIFAEGKDTYKDFATEVYGIPYEQVTKDMRSFCKPPTLGCGYQLAAFGLVEYARGMGVIMTMKDATRIVKIYRDTYPEVRQMWWDFIDIAKEVILYGTEREAYKCKFTRDDNFFIVTLPSGRNMYYYRPEIRKAKAPWEVSRLKEELSKDKITRQEYDQLMEEVKLIDQVTYMGRCSKSTTWRRIATHGGKFTENFDQGISRDLLYAVLLKVSKHPKLRNIIDLLFHVHDEGIYECPDHLAQRFYDYLRNEMSKPPWWADGLILDAEGYIAKRYRKG